MDVPRISRFGQVPVALKQEDRDLGCIPTNLAAVLQAYGVPSNVATEGNLARAYQSTINFERIQAEVLQKTQGMLGYDLSPFRLVHEPGIKRFNDWWNKTTGWIDEDSPVLFSFKPATAWHIRTAIGYESDKLETYDPWPEQPFQVVETTKQELQQKWKLGHLAGELLALTYSR